MPGSFFSTMLGLLLVAGIAASQSLPGVRDHTYLQDISHRQLYLTSTPSVSTWDILPFAYQPNSIFQLDQSSCYISLSGGTLYSSSKKNPFPNKVERENPFEAWTKLVDIGDSAYLASPLHGSSSVFFVVTTSNVLRVTLSASARWQGCGAVASVEPLWSTDALPVPNQITSVYFSTTVGWLGTSDGLYAVALSDSSDHTTGDVWQINDVTGAVASVYLVTKWNQLYVGASSLFMLSLSPDKLWNVVSAEHEWLGGNIDTVPLDFSFDNEYGCLWLAEKNSVHRRCDDGAWLRYGFHQGSPFANITSVAAIGGQVWVGSQLGLARVSSNADPTQLDDTCTQGEPAQSGSNPWTFLVFAGPRYLPDNIVSLLAADHSSTSQTASVLVATATGLTYMQSELWILREKAAAMESFQNPRHDRHGLTAEVNLNVYGDVNSYYKVPHDNDGLWTAMHAVGQAYRYMATGEVSAREAAWRAFEGLELLNKVTDAYPKFPARTCCMLSEKCGVGSDEWFNSTTLPDFNWKGDTSSDEMVGHMMAMAILLDTAANTDDRRQRVITIVDGLMRGIVENDLYLIDPKTGEPTLWGFWNPDAINNNPDHYSERGINSLEILAFLTSAYSVTRDTLFKDTYTDLVQNHHYVQNALNCKIDSPDDDNHSDNELIFNSYFTLFYAWRRIPDSDSAFKQEVWSMCEPLVPSLRRTYMLVKGERSPLWLSIYAAVAKQSVPQRELSDAVWSLRQSAIDLINWPTVNSDRWDITKQPFHVRNGDAALMRGIRPPAERQVSHWNNDPFQMDITGGGGSEYEPASWTQAYWILVANGLLYSM